MNTLRKVTASIGFGACLHRHGRLALLEELVQRRIRTGQSRLRQTLLNVAGRVGSWRAARGGDNQEG